MPLQLSWLPSEILGVIFNGYSHSFLVIDLWMCGDSTLNKKLETGVTHLFLEQVSEVPKALPSVVYRLRSLRLLSVKSGSWLMKHPLDWPIARSRLPKTLETLNILSKDACFAFMNFAPDWSWTNRLYIETEYSLGKSRFCDIEMLLPSLKSLQLDSFFRYQHGYEEALSVLDLPGLPSKLTCLTTYMIESTMDCHLVLSRLPRSLTHLDASVATSLRDPETYELNEVQPPVSDWHAAPALLERMGMLYTSYSDPTLHWLPRTLIEYDRPLSNTIWTPQLMHSLPPLQQHVLIGTLDLDSFATQQLHWAECLPKNVTSLTFAPQDSTDMLQFSLPKDIELLPRTLKEIEIMLMHVDYPPPWERYASPADLNWPPSLEELTLYRCNAQISDLNTLPPSIRSIALHADSLTGPNHHHIVGSRLPRNLTSLTCETPSDNRPLLSVSIEGPLPSYLSSFSIFNDQFCTGPKIDRTSFEALPSSLTYLAVSITGVTDKDDPWTLPSQLRSLTITGWHIGALKHIPRTVTYLGLWEIDGCLDMTCADYLMDLPREISTLVLHSAIEGEPTGPCLPEKNYFLSPHLRDLRVFLPWNFSPSILKHLPRQLKELSLHLGALEKDHISLIPPFVQSCFLGETDPLPQDLVELWPLSDARKALQPLMKSRLRSFQDQKGFEFWTQVQIEAEEGEGEDD